MSLGTIGKDSSLAWTVKFDDFEEGQELFSKPVAGTYDPDFYPSSWQEVGLTLSKAKNTPSHTIPLQVLFPPSSHHRAIVKLHSNSDLQRTLFEYNQETVVLSPASKEEHFVKDFEPGTPRTTLLKVGVLAARGEVANRTSFEFNPATAKRLSIGIEPQQPGAPSSPTRLHVSVTIDPERKEKLDRAKEAKHSLSSLLLEGMTFSEKCSLRWKMLTSRKHHEDDDE